MLLSEAFRQWELPQKSKTVTADFKRVNFTIMGVIVKRKEHERKTQESEIPRGCLEAIENYAF